jgi:HK97 family phage major capsid protein
MAPNPTIERDVAGLRSDIKTKRDEAAKAKAKAEALVADEKQAGRDPVRGLKAEDREAFGRIEAAYKEGDVLAEEAMELERRLHTLLDNHRGESREVSGGDPTHPLARQARTLGAIAAGTEAYKLIVKGEINPREREVSLGEIANRRQSRALLSARYAQDVRADAGDGSPLVPSDETDLIPPVAIPKRQPTVLDLITVGTTARDGVTYTRQTARTVAGTTTVAFGTAFQKSRYQYETVPVPVLRKGHYAVVDEGNITDQEEFQDIVNDELITDLRLIVENDIMAATGDGTTEWEGIYENSGIGSVDADDPAFDNRADAFHHAMTVVRVQLEMEPTSWGIDPVGFEEFWLEKDDVGRYLHNRGPADTPLRSIWGLPASVSTVFTKPVVAEWARAAKLWIREGIVIAISNNVDDFFLEDQYAVKARFRGGFAVKQPKAVCVVDGLES